MSIGGVRVTIATQNLFSPSSPHTELSHLQHASPSSVMRGPPEELVCANSVAQSLCVAGILGRLPSLIMRQSPSLLCCRLPGHCHSCQSTAPCFSPHFIIPFHLGPKAALFVSLEIRLLIKKKKKFPNSVLKAPYRLDITKRC